MLTCLKVAPERVNYMDDVPVWSISPNPTVMHLTPLLKAGVARIKRAIQRKQGLCMIVGDIGLGKSSLLRYVSSNYDMDEEKYSISYLHDSRKCKTPFDFLKMISEDFGIPPKRSQIAQMSAIEEFLATNYQAGKTTIVFVDEGQRLPLETLELMRSLLNYETDTHKLAQFVVAGQLELRDRLMKRQYEAFRSRIVAPIVMQPLTMEETKNMIQSRLESWDLVNPFSPDAIASIYNLSGGVPREILLLCQHSCDIASTDGNLLRLVSGEDVSEAHKTLAITDPEEVAEVPEYEPVS
jgi:general secretion pathway protein A